MRSINEFERGGRVRIKALECAQGLKKRLAELGVFEGAQVEIIRNDRKNPLLLKVFNSKIVLDQKGAGQIYGERI